MRGQIITLKTFEDEERGRAEDSRLEIELDLHRRKIEHEVVLLQAASEEALRCTHRRYFEDLAETREHSVKTLFCAKFTSRNPP